jgi:hypothetical protein
MAGARTLCLASRRSGPGCGSAAPHGTGIVPGDLAPVRSPGSYRALKQTIDLDSDKPEPQVRPDEHAASNESCHLFHIDTWGDPFDRVSSFAALTGADREAERRWDAESPELAGAAPTAPLVARTRESGAVRRRWRSGLPRNPRPPRPLGAESATSITFNDSGPRRPSRRAAKGLHPAAPDSDGWAQPLRKEAARCQPRAAVPASSSPAGTAPTERYAARA